MFVDKLNKKQEGVYVLEEEKIIVDGKWEGYLDHDNVEPNSVYIYTQEKLGGNKVDNYFISTSAEMPWKLYLKVFSNSPKIFITYESKGDQVEAEDVNLIQNEVNTQNIKVANLVAETLRLENTKANLTYVDTELLKKYDKDKVYTKEEVEQLIDDLIGGSPGALDTLKEIADALNNDPDFASTMTTELSKKVDKITGKSLSDENYTITEKSKLAEIEDKANNYIHPLTHSADMIEENINKRFVSDIKINKWDNMGAVDTSELAGEGRTTETVKQNADNIVAVKNDLASYKTSNTAELNKKVNTNDYDKIIPYKVATGGANNYVVNLNPAITNYAEGLAVCIKINIANTGASTININGKGVKSIRDGKGNVLKAGSLRVGGVYTLRYDGVNFQLQGEGGDDVRHGQLAQKFGVYWQKTTASLGTSGQKIIEVLPLNSGTILVTENSFLKVSISGSVDWVIPFPLGYKQLGDYSISLNQNYILISMRSPVGTSYYFTTVEVYNVNNGSLKASHTISSHCFFFVVDNIGNFAYTSNGVLTYYNKFSIGYTNHPLIMIDANYNIISENIDSISPSGVVSSFRPPNNGEGEILYYDNDYLYLYNERFLFFEKISLSTGVSSGKDIFMGLKPISRLKIKSTLPVIKILSAVGGHTYGYTRQNVFILNSTLDGLTFIRTYKENIVPGEKYLNIYHSEGDSFYFTSEDRMTLFYGTISNEIL